MTDIAELVKELYKYPCSADVERRAARALESQAESLDEAHAGLAITIAQRDQSPPPPPAGPRRGVIAKPPKPAECTCCWCITEPCPVHAPPATK